MKTANSLYGLTTVDLSDLDFKDARDENGIPICCMTCAKWSFGRGRSCEVDPRTTYNVCPSWVCSKHYKGGSNGSNQSKTP